MEYRLNGSAFVKRLIRPPRIAVVMSSLDHAEKFLRIASLSWGGRYFLPIPFTEKDGISDEWLNVIEKYNPDYIMTFYELPHEIQEKLWESQFTVNKIWGDSDIKIEQLNQTDYRNRTPEFWGQPILNFLLLDEAYEISKGKIKIAHVPLDQGFDLFYKARYGVIDKDEWYRWQEVYIKPGHRKYLPDDLIDNVEFSVEQDILSFLYEARNKKRSDMPLSLMDYTVASLGQSYIDRVFLSERPKSEASNIVVVSKEENVEDFCWFWALRGQRYHPYDIYSKGPIWINQNHFIAKHDLLQPLFAAKENVYITDCLTQLNFGTKG